MVNEYCTIKHSKGYLDFIFIKFGKESKMEIKFDWIE